MGTGRSVGIESLSGAQRRARAFLFDSNALLSIVMGGKKDAAVLVLHSNEALKWALTAAKAHSFY
jgi:hypothetical protein